MTTGPNILIFMVDQLAGTLFPDGPAEFLKVPHLRGIAENGVRFASSYSASPLCAPSRASFMSGLLPSRTGVYDNAAEFASSIPTFAHHLRRAGYRTCLSGKMHFVGPDQLHGFEERLTTDVYPADFAWTPDWTNPEQRIDWWYHNLGSVTDAGTAEITNQLEYDDEVASFAKQRLYQMARQARDRPFCLTVSFTHPHDPYVARRKYWDLYPEADLPPLAVPAIPYEEQDPHSQRLFRAADYRKFEIGEQNVIDSRRAYFANISYLDDKIGEILQVLRDCDLDRDTVILFCADHGDMLGERGLWFKMCFFEGSIRVPLIIHAPDRFAPRLVTDPVSTLDILPTLVALAGGASDNLAVDGRSLLDLCAGSARPATPVLAEYAAEGSVDPLVMIRSGKWKFAHCDADPPQLFDLGADPLERVNLAGDPARSATEAAFRDQVAETWDIARFRSDVLRSQAHRLTVYPALRNGSYYPWDYQPLQKASERYMRNHLDLNDLEAAARYPKA